MLKLPQENREPVFEQIDIMLAQILFVVQIVFMAIQWGSFRVATGAEKTLPPTVLLTIFGSSTITLILVVLQLSRIDAALKKAVKATLPGKE